MKKIVYKFSAILFYLIILLYATKFDFLILVDFKVLFLVIFGTVILSMPSFKKTLDWSDLLNLLNWNGMIAGYTTTFVLLFIRMSSGEANNLLYDIALNCRPILYGFIIFFITKREEKQDTRINSEETVPVTSEQIYYKFRELGLTEREAEIARLARNRMSNGEIAEELCIAESTVKKHMSHIFEKLNISAREELRTYLETN